MRASWRKSAAAKYERRKPYMADYCKKNREHLRAQKSAQQRSEKSRRQRRAHHAEERRKFPEKYKARDAVHYQVRAGHMKPQTCEVCSARKAQAHHDDYSKPLNVRWLCDAHHKEVHRAIRSEAA